MSEDTCKEYWDSVRTHAECVAERTAAGEEFSDVLHEECDGSYWVIYYHASRQCLEFSPNEDACFDVMGDGALEGCDSYGMVTTRLAYFALQQDVSEAAQELIDAKEAS
jgi:hypothetical protein